MAASMSGLVWEPFTLAGMDAAWMRLSREHRRRRVILYCHGGGYTSGGLGFSKVLASKLTRATGMDTLAFDYRLAPEHPYPAAVEDALTAWGHLESLGISAGGYSSGGRLRRREPGSGLCLKLREAGRGLPGALLLMSPWTDMTAFWRKPARARGDRPRAHAGYMYAVREAYAGGLDPSDCLLSRRSSRTLRASRRRSSRWARTRYSIPTPSASRSGCSRQARTAAWRSGRICGTTSRCTPARQPPTPSRIWPISCWKCSDGAAPAQYRQNTPHKQAGFLYMFFRLKAAKKPLMMQI